MIIKKLNLIIKKINEIAINKKAGKVIHNAKILADVFVTLSFGKEIGRASCRERV